MTSHRTLFASVGILLQFAFAVPASAQACFKPTQSEAPSGAQVNAQSPLVRLLSSATSPRSVPAGKAASNYSLCTWCIRKI
jgi:hypothetical protein